MQIIVLGRIGYDLYAEERNVPLSRTTRFARYLGGSSANMAVGLRRLGLSTAVISCLGTDALSDFLLDYLREEEVDTRFVQRKAGFLPSFCLTEVSPPDRFPQVFYRDRPADTQLEIGDEELRYVTSAGLFVTNGTSLCAAPSRESTFRALEAARAAGVPTALDVDYRADSWPDPSQAGLYARLALPFVEVLIANPEELCLTGGAEDIGEAARRLWDQGVPLLVVKLGAAGVLAVSREEAFFLAPFPVEVLCTIGAGDGFASGFLYSYVRRSPLTEALRFGNAAAAIVVSRIMCAEAMPRHAEVEEFLQQKSLPHPRAIDPGRLKSELNRLVEARESDR